jgi:molybdopterin-binding protein
MSRLDIVSFIGRDELGAVLETKVAAHDRSSGLTTLRSAAGDLHVPRLDLPTAAAVRVRIRARDALIAAHAPTDLSALNVIEGTVTEARRADHDMVELRLDCDGEPLVARLTRHSVDRLGLAPGRRVYAVVKAVAIDGYSATPREGAPAGGGPTLTRCDGPRPGVQAETRRGRPVCRRDGARRRAGSSRRPAWANASARRWGATIRVASVSIARYRSTRRRPHGVRRAPPPCRPPVCLDTTGRRKLRFRLSTSSHARRYDMRMARPASLIDPCA